MSEQTKKGHLWRSPISNGRYEYFVVKDSMCIDEETEFHRYIYAPGEGGIDAWGINPDPAPFTNFNVLEENLEIKRVDYNKRKLLGNKVVIEPDSQNEGGVIVEVSDDFVPGSAGATYVFRYPGEAGGPYEDVYVVGQTTVPDAEYVFDGMWAWFNEFNGPVFDVHGSNCYEVVLNELNGEFVVVTACM